MLVHLFSGRVVELRPRPGDRRSLPPAGSGPLFSFARSMFASGDVEIREDGRAVDIAGFTLSDFHALRAIATHEGWLDEETLDLDCKNCSGPIEHAPCAALAIGPFESGDLNDEELDSRVALGRPHPTAAGAITLEERTLEEATPLHRALAQGPLDITAEVVRAMGIVALGDERRPERIARALREASDEAWSEVTECFILAHYRPRLFSIARCPACGARNDVDAPYDREFEVAPIVTTKLTSPSPSNDEDFPDFERFSRRAHALAEPLLAAHEGVALVVDGGVPPCDDGGEPLLGSYVPETAGSAEEPSRPPEVSLYYRTFRAIHEDEGPYDWEAELRETLEHEIAHHVAYLAGDDPMDEEERRAIDREAERIHGRRALLEARTNELGRGVGDFLRRTWPIWLLLAAGTIAATMLEK